MALISRTNYKNHQGGGKDCGWAADQIAGEWGWSKLEPLDPLAWDPGLQTQTPSPFPIKIRDVSAPVQSLWWRPALQQQRSSPRATWVARKSWPKKMAVSIARGSCGEVLHSWRPWPSDLLLQSAILLGRWGPDATSAQNHCWRQRLGLSNHDEVSITSLEIR